MTPFVVVTYQMQRQVMCLDDEQWGHTKWDVYRRLMQLRRDRELMSTNYEIKILKDLE